MMEPVRYYDPMFCRKSLMQALYVFGGALLFAGLFLVGAEFGRQEVLHAIPRCNGDEYLTVNVSPLEHPSSTTDLLCVPFNQRPSK